MRQMVVGFMFSPELDRVVLIRKNRPDWQRGLFNGVGGHRQGQGKEMPREAMAREFLEEAGVRTEPDQWIYKLNLINMKVGYELAVLHMTSDLAHEVRTMTDEQVVFVAVDTALQSGQLLPNLRWMIPLCLDPQIKPVVLMEDIGGN